LGALPLQIGHLAHETAQHLAESGPREVTQKSRAVGMGMVGITFLWVDGYGDFPPNHPSHWTIWVLKFMVTCQLADPPFQEANWHGVN